MPATLSKRPWGLENAEGYLIGKAGKKPIGTVAREAVQMAEDARIITVKKIEEEQLATERRVTAERQARAEGDTAALCRKRTASREKRNKRGSPRRAPSDSAKQRRPARERRADDARLAAQTEADRLKRENDAQLLAANTETDRLNRRTKLRDSPRKPTWNAPPKRRPKPRPKRRNFAPTCCCNSTRFSKLAIPRAA
jgi:hypothetical protein